MINKRKSITSRTKRGRTYNIKVNQRIYPKKKKRTKAIHLTTAHRIMCQHELHRCTREGKGNGDGRILNKITSTLLDIEPRSISSIPNCPVQIQSERSLLPMRHRLPGIISTNAEIICHHDNVMYYFPAATCCKDRRCKRNREGGWGER